MAGGELMIRAVANYLAARRAAGFELKSQCYLLQSFARFAAARGETHIRTATAIDWASRTVSVAQRDARLKAVCRFARYIRVEDSRHELPPSGHFGYRRTRPLPHIYSREEIHRLMNAALRLEQQHSSSAQTYVTLIGLLAATGLRISEALNLQLSDEAMDLFRRVDVGQRAGLAVAKVTRRWQFVPAVFSPQVTRKAADSFQSCVSLCHRYSSTGPIDCCCRVDVFLTSRGSKAREAAHQIGLVL